MIILDCESYSSTINSLGNIYTTTTYKIEEFFKAFDLDKHYEMNDPRNTGLYELRNVFEDQLQLEPNKLNTVCWFHLTRGLPEETFNEGLLPLSKSLEAVWEVFLNVFRETEHFDNINEMKRNGVDNYHYKLKANSDTHSGPYAMLVKDISFNSQAVGNHNYLEIPEIMEDICNGYNKTYGEPIIDYLEKTLKPKIIKFISSKTTGIHCVEAALYYAYTIYNKQKISLNANTCFDGENTTIPCSEILKVETINA